MMNRRAFVTGLGAVLAASLGAEAQPTVKVPRIGILANNSPAGSAEWAAFGQSLRELGWIEDHNVTVTYRSAEGQPDRFRMLAGELVYLKVDVIVVAGPPAINAA